MNVVFKKGALDTRADQLRVFVSQGLPSTADDILRTFMAREERIGDLRNELQPAALNELLCESGSQLLDVCNAIRASAQAERAREQDAIEAEARRRDGEHASSTAAAVNFTRLRESVDVLELRAILASARRAGQSSYDDAVAILRPRLQRLAAGQMIAPALGQPQRLDSPFFRLLCELGRMGRFDDRARLDAVDRRRDAKLAQVMSAAAVVHRQLPGTIARLELEAKRSEIVGDGPDRSIVFGRFWEQQKPR